MMMMIIIIIISVRCYWSNQESFSVQQLLYGLDYPGIDSPEGKRFSFLQNVHISSVGPPKLVLDGKRGFFRGVKVDGTWLWP